VLSDGIVPRFYMQSYDGTIYGFEHLDDMWEQTTSFKQPNMRLVKAH